MRFTLLLTAALLSLSSLGLTNTSARTNGPGATDQTNEVTAEPATRASSLRLLPLD